MSAFLVSKAHIDALVQLATCGPETGYRFSNWYPWLGSEAHTRGLREHPDALGALLWQENLNSLTARYPRDVSGTRPGPIGITDDAIAAYTYQRPAHRLTLVEAFKAIACYEYQSCEHDGWEPSTAHAICQGLRHTLISALPGYADAAWEIAS